MKVLLSWLRELAPLPGDAAVVAEACNELGLAVEEVVPVLADLERVVVARVLSTRPHPQADRIQLVDVDAGDGEALQIACGAFNFAAGDLVPLATLGTVMPGGLEIGRRKLRGEWSNGMLCSAEELQLPAAGEKGILVLPGDLPLGVPVAEALGVAGDVLLDLDVTPNRPDAMSVAGVARDLAARFGVPFALPEVPAEGGADGDVATSDLVTVEIVDPVRCGRFVARVLRDVAVGTSAPWLATRLLLAGMRPINSVVDASNYVMLELGEPNHAYDGAKLRGGGFRVRRARSGERLTTLDGVERELDEDDLLICDGEDAPISLAGVMGGASTEIDASTTEVVLETAWFEPLGIARTSKRHGLRTEGSVRWERGVDPQVLELAAARFAQLAGGRLVPGQVDVLGELPPRPPLRLRTARVNGLLGTALGRDEIAGLLAPLGFEPRPEGDDLVATPPSWRPDARIEEDLIEEVARHHGYGRIAKTVRASGRPGGLTPAQADRRALRQVLVGLGLTEVMPSSLVSPADLARAGVSTEAVALVHPLAAEESVLRTSLLPGLVGVVARNAAHRETGVRIFEIAHVFAPPPPGEGPLPDERERLGVALAGCEAPAAKEVWDAIAGALDVRGLLEVRPSLDAAPAGLHPTRSARIVAADGVELGVLGEVDPDVLAASGVEERVAWLDLDLGALLAQPHGAHTYRPVSRYPSSDLDLAFVVDEGVPAASVEAVLRESLGDLLVRLALFDRFRSDALGPGRRSLAWRLRLQAPDRTLTETELAEARTRAIGAVTSALPAQLRS